MPPRAGVLGTSPAGGRGKPNSSNGSRCQPSDDGAEARGTIDSVGDRQLRATINQAGLARAGHHGADHEQSFAGRHAVLAGSGSDDEHVAAVEFLIREEFGRRVPGAVSKSFETYLCRFDTRHDRVISGSETSPPSWLGPLQPRSQFSPGVVRLVPDHVNGIGIVRVLPVDHPVVDAEIFAFGPGPVA